MRFGDGRLVDYRHKLIGQSFSSARRGFYFHQLRDNLNKGNANYTIMTRNLFLLVLTVFCSIYTLGSSPKPVNDQRIDRIEMVLSDYQHRVDSLEYEQSFFTAKLEATEALMTRHFSVISNELSASDRFLVYFGVFLTLLSVFLGVFITTMQNKMKDMSIQVSDMEADITKKRDEIVLIKEQINNHFDEYYNRIRRADTVSLLKRLDAVPQDISNLIRSLSARDLEPEDFDVLISAYKKLVESGKEDAPVDLAGPSYGFEYKVLFFQHFPGKAISEDFLRIRIQPEFKSLVSCCFDNDIKKSLSDIAPILHQTGLAFDRVSLLSDLLQALRESEFKDNAEVFSILQNGIADEELWEKANAAINKDDKPEEE